jgi:ketosteroid isomerase-like protein
MARALALAALLAVAAPAHLEAQCSDADKAALEALDKAWSVATNSGDKAFLENIHAVGYVGHGPFGTTDRATSISNAMTTAERNRANPRPLATADHFMISCTANSAVITHRVVLPPAAGSTNPAGYNRAIHFMERRGNSWQAVSSTAHALQDAAVLAYMERDWNDAFKRGDSEWIEKNFAPYSSEVSGRTGAISNKTQSVAAAKGSAGTFESLELSELSARVNGETAVVTGVNHVKGKDSAGKPFDRRLRFTDTFVKRDGRWMVWATHGTDLK